MNNEILEAEVGAIARMSKILLGFGDHVGTFMQEERISGDLLKEYEELVGKVLDASLEGEIAADLHTGMMMARGVARGLRLFDREMNETMNACKAKGLGPTRVQP